MLVPITTKNPRRPVSGIHAYLLFVLEPSGTRASNKTPGAAANTRGIHNTGSDRGYCLRPGQWNDLRQLTENIERKRRFPLIQDCSSNFDELLNFNPKFCLHNTNFNHFLRDNFVTCIYNPLSMEVVAMVKV